jgi:hypothetical protein
MREFPNSPPPIPECPPLHNFVILTLKEEKGKDLHFGISQHLHNILTLNTVKGRTCVYIAPSDLPTSHEASGGPSASRRDAAKIAQDEVLGPTVPKVAQASRRDAAKSRPAAPVLARLGRDRLSAPPPKKPPRDFFPSRGQEPPTSPSARTGAEGAIGRTAGARSWPHRRWLWKTCQAPFRKIVCNPL